MKVKVEEVKANYSWCVLQHSRGRGSGTKRNHIVHMDTKKSICGAMETFQTVDKSAIIFKKKKELFRSTVCVKCIRIAGFLGIDLENL